MLERALWLDALAHYRELFDRDWLENLSVAEYSCLEDSGELTSIYTTVIKSASQAVVDRTVSNKAWVLQEVEQAIKVSTGGAK